MCEVGAVDAIPCGDVRVPGTIVFQVNFHRLDGSWLGDGGHDVGVEHGDALALDDGGVDDDRGGCGAVQGDVGPGAEIHRL